MSETVEADCRALRRVAQRFSPILRFHEKERFYPVLAESFLTHTTQAPWEDDPAHHLGDIFPDRERRGMALCEMVDGALKVLAGQPVGRDRPLQFTDDSSDPYAIGREELRAATEQVFLNLGGWPSNRYPMSTGDLERLYALFSELAAAINPNNDWTPLDGERDFPYAWIPQPVSPTAYCEATEASNLVWLSSNRLQRPDFPRDEGMLNQFLVMTYYYLYPAKDQPIDPRGMRHEGQWEAVSLFFRGRGLGERGAVIFTPPEWVVASQGETQTAVNGFHNEVREWSQVTKRGDHPVLYVAKGTHHFYFEPVKGLTTDPNATPTPGADPGSHSNTESEGGITEFGVAGAVLLVVGALLVIVFGIAAAILLVLLALWLLFQWLKSIFDAADNDGSGAPVPATQGNDEASDSGNQAGGDEDPAPAAPDAGGGDGLYGLPNSGSPTGRATVSFDVRFIDRLQQHHDRHERYTPYPSPEPCENPAWWDYSGCWGVRVQHGFSSEWERGSRRVDEFGRSWAYWNALRLSTKLHGGAPKG